VRNLEYELLENLKGVSLNLFFNDFQRFSGDIYKDPSVKEKFLELLVALIKDGELKLAKDGKFLEGTPEEQVDIIRQSWPVEYDPDVMEKDIDNLWWVTECPVGAVWIYPDGYEEWT
jgi:hypothetical protein